MLDLLRKLRRFARACLGKDLFSTASIRVEKERVGSKLGGWEVATKLLHEGSIVYSIGVGHDVTFDVGLIERYGLTVHAFDPTPRSIEWVHQQDLPFQFVLHEFGVAGYDGDATFFPHENPDYVSHTILARPTTQDRSITVPVRRLASIMKELGHAQIDLLKMDIEGAEYSVIEDLSRSSMRPAQILVEFHHRFQSIGLDKTRAALKTMRNMGYEVFAVSSTGEEFCFVHRA